MFKLLLVLDVFDAEEDATQNQRQKQKQRKQLFPAGLGRPDRHGHGKAASDEHDGVGRTELQIQHVPADPERWEVRVAVDGGGGEENTKKKELCDPEYPHTP